MWRPPLTIVLTTWQDPENMAMDVDGDEEGIQRPRQMETYGVEVDFDSLDAKDREASSVFNFLMSHLP